MKFLEIFLSYSWILILVPISYFAASIYNYKKYKNNQIDSEDDMLIYEAVISEEKKHLNIEIEKKDITIFKKRIEDLVNKLKDTNSTFHISSVEAILLVELYSEKVVISENGELVIDLKVASNFSENILNDPKKFMTYIKAIENKIDIKNKNNKIELSEVLYMMRNARRFSLDDLNSDKTLLFKITSEIHENGYSDVLVKVIDNSTIVKDGNDVTKNIILHNIAEENIETQQTEDTKIESFEKMEDGNIKIKMKDGTVFFKNDLMIYSVEVPEDKSKTPSKNNTKKDAQKLIHEEDTELELYKSLFGDMSEFEKRNTKERLFRDRAISFFDMQLFGRNIFNINEMNIENIFINDKEFYYFLGQLFNKKFVIKNHIPSIFIGTLNLRNKEPIEYISIDINYFFSIIYLLFKREYRETFFQYIYTKEKLNIKNINTFLSMINDKYKIFYPEKNNYLFDSVYSYNTQTIKTKIIRINFEIFKNLLIENNDIYDFYNELKNILDNKINTVSFGIRAIEYDSNVILGQKTFFREHLDEKPF